MTRNTLIALAAGGSLALLIGAYVFQALGYPPCPLCWWQRYPHFAAVAFGCLAFAVRGPLFPILGSIAASATALVGVYHSGIERDWWEGPSKCTGDPMGQMSGADLLSLDAPTVVMCDQISWIFLRGSMANWNVLISAILVVLWVLAARRSGNAPVRRRV